MPLSRKNLPPLNALRTFEVAGRRLSFRAASEELGVTQGAVVQQVRLLEDYLGLPLFTRLPRGVALTAQSKAYHAEVSRAFDSLQRATAKFANSADVLTMSVTPTFATRLLIPQLSALGTALPGVQIRTVATVTMSNFDQDQVDIAFRETRPPFPASLETQLLFRQELVVVGSPHLLGDCSLPLARERIRSLPLLHDTYDHWPTFFETDRKLPGAAFNQVSLALDAALAGQGLAIACRAFVQGDLDAGRLLEVCRAGFETGSDYYLVRKRSSHPRDTIDAVWSWCITTFAAGSSAEQPPDN